MSEWYIAHHGILGQKWGRRNGPPYPLNVSDHSASEKRAGWRKSLSKSSPARRAGSSSNKSEEKEKFHLTDKQKKYLKIGAVVVGAALVTYGAYKLGSMDKLGDIGLKGSNAVDRILKRNRGAGDFLNDLDDLSIATGIARNKTPISIAESTKKVNPGYSSGEIEYQRNCFSAVTADLLNRSGNGMGLDAKARPATSEEIRKGGISFIDILKPFSGAKSDEIIIPKNTSAKDHLAKKILESTNNSDSFGIIRVRSAERSSAGHFIKWEVLDGKCVFSDSLSGSIDRADAYLNAVGGRISRGIEFARVDNSTINPFEVTKYVRG